MTTKSPTVRIIDDFAWEFAGRRRRLDGAGSPVAHIDDLDGCTATDLRAALIRHCGELGGYGDHILISEGNPDSDIEDGFVGPVSFSLHEDQTLVMDVAYSTTNYIDDEAELLTQVEQLLAPLLARYRMWLVTAVNNEGVAVEPWIVELKIGFHARGRMIGDITRIGQDAIALLEAVDTGSIGR